MFVLDASAALSWCLEDETSSVIDVTLGKVATNGAHVPMVWPIEVSNALLQAARRKRLSVAQVKQKLELLDSLPLTAHQIDRSDAFGRLLDLSLDHQLTVYDATYLALASKLGLPLVTLDRALGAAAQRSRLQVITS